MLHCSVNTGCKLHCFRPRRICLERQLCSCCKIGARHKEGLDCKCLEASCGIDNMHSTASNKQQIGYKIHFLYVLSGRLIQPVLYHNCTFNAVFRSNSQTEQVLCAGGVGGGRQTWGRLMKLGRTAWSWMWMSRCSSFLMDWLSSSMRR